MGSPNSAAELAEMAESWSGLQKVARKILVYGRQAFASQAFCEMLAKEFPERKVVDANSRDGLAGLDANGLDLVVVTTSAAANESDMNELGFVLRTAQTQPVLVILGDIGLAAKPEQAADLNLRGIFPDQTDPAVVLAGLRFILAGGQYFPKEIRGVDTSIDSIEVPSAPKIELASASENVTLPEVAFTARERAVLKCIARGLPNKAISRVLGIAENTTKIHVRGILRKLGCANRTEAALLSQRFDLTETV